MLYYVTDYYQTLIIQMICVEIMICLIFKPKKIDENENEKIETNKCITLGKIAIALSTFENNKSLDKDGIGIMKY